MNENEKKFAEQLLQVERTNPTLQEKYKKEIQMIYEKKLTGIKKLSWIGVAVMGLGFAALFGTMAVIVSAEFPLLGRLGFAIGAIFGLAWFALAVEILKKGAIDLKSHSQAATGLSWVFVVIIAILSMFLARNMPANKGILMMVNALVFLVMGVAFLLTHKVEQAELKTREKLLGIEYRLAELAETMAGSKNCKEEKEDTSAN